MTNTSSHTHDCEQPELHAEATPSPVNLSSPGRIAPDEAAKITRRITRYSVCVGVLLIALKFFTWKETDSAGVLSSLVHSSLDLLAALATYFGVRYAARAPNRKHSFGLGKAEGIIAIFQVAVVLFSAMHVFEHGVESLTHAHEVHHGTGGLIAMIVAILLTACLLFAQNHAISSTGSVAIKGDRAHFLADMAANVAVIIGLALATFTPFVKADAIVAILIALWLVFTAFRVGKMAYSQLMDKELPDTERDYIHSLASDDKQILAIKDLRTRASGPHVHIQMQAELSDSLSLVEAHNIIARAEERIISAFPAADVTVNPAPKGRERGNSLFRRKGDI